MVNYTKIAIKGAITIFVISIIAAFLGYLVRVTLARNLTVEEFGLFYAVFAFLALLGIFKTFGFDKSLVKFIPELVHKNKNDLIKSSIIYVSIIQLITNSIIIILIYLLANYLSVHYFHNTQASWVLKLMAIAFFIDSFALILKFGLQGFQKMTMFAFMDLTRMALIMAIVTLGLKMNYGLLSPVIAYIFTPIVLLVIFGWMFYKYAFPKFIGSKFIVDNALLKKISKYSFFIMLAGSGDIILGYTDSIMLTYFSGLTAVGLYNVALPTAKLLLYLPTAIAIVLLPVTSELLAKRKKGLLKAGIESLYKYSMIIIIPLAFVIFSFANLAIGIMFGKNYILAETAMKILVVGMVFATMHLINISFFQGMGKPQIYSKIIYAAAVFNLIGNLILIPILGITGAAITTTVSYFIMMAIGFRSITKIIKLTFPIKIWIKTLTAGLIFTFVIWFLKKMLFLNVFLESAIVLALSGAVYVALLFLFKIVDTNELKDLYKRVVK